MTDCRLCARYMTGESNRDPRIRAATVGHVACSAGALLAVPVSAKAAVPGFIMACLTWFRPHEAATPLHCLAFAEREALTRGFVEGDHDDEPPRETKTRHSRKALKAQAERQAALRVRQREQAQAEGKTHPCPVCATMTANVTCSRKCAAAWARRQRGARA